MLNKLHIFISVIAGIVYTVYCLVNYLDLIFWAKHFIIIIVLFYILGLITRNYLKTVLISKNDIIENSDESEFLENDDEFDDFSDENVDDDSSNQKKPKKKIDFNKDDN